MKYTLLGIAIALISIFISIGLVLGIFIGKELTQQVICNIK